MTARPPLRVFSVGAGVQTTTLALAMRDELIARPDYAIFADTGWEPAEVYDHLHGRLAPLFAELGIPLIVDSNGNIRADALDPSHRFASMPLFVKQTIDDRVPVQWAPCLDCSGQGFHDVDAAVADPTCSTCSGDGSIVIAWETRSRVKPGMMRRQCTNEYKLRVIRRHTWRLHNEHGRPGIVQIIGISADEVGRMRDSDVRYITNTYPLVEELGWTRARCEEELAARGWSAPRSACIGCPFHTDAEWRRMRDHDPVSFADAVEFDDAIRSGNARLLNDRTAELRGTAFLHRKRIPLRDVTFDEPPAAEAAPTLFDDTFGDECLGMCGN